jgi:hypothetical protein
MKNKHLYAILLSIFCVVTLLTSLVVNKVSADTLTDTTTRSMENLSAPLVDPTLQRPILTISVENIQIIMKVNAPGASVVTINCKNERGEAIIYRPTPTPDGFWFLALPVAGVAPGTYTATAFADSGNSVYGQSNIASYIIKAPESPTVTAPTSGSSTSSTSTTTSPIVTNRQSEVVIDNNIDTQTSTTLGTTASSPTTDAVVLTQDSQTTIEVTTLPEKFARNVEQIRSTKIVDLSSADSPVIESIKNIEVTAVEQGTTKTTQKDAIVFSGKAKPNSIIYLYIFSDPIVVSVKADENGNWQYILDRPLDTGKHESYVLIEDPETKEVMRTEAKSFFISKARATSSMMDIPGNKGIILEDPFTAMVRDYGVYVGIIIGLAVLAVLFFGLRKYRKAEANESDFVAKNEQ